MSEPAQRAFDFQRRTRDGRIAKRPGPKPSGKRRDPRHRIRPEVSARYPVHVVLRVAREVGSMRTRHAYRAIRSAVDTCAARSDFRVVHVSIQSDHVHLVVEADDKRALTLGMQGFAISAAKHLNRELGRKRGEVFPFRYHATLIETPTQARDTIRDVLNNWRCHGADARAPSRIDPYSSADRFDGWERPPPYTPRADPLPVVRPTSWLLRDGWRRAGPIRLDELPGPDPEP